MNNKFKYLYILVIGIILTTLWAFQKKKSGSIVNKPEQSSSIFTCPNGEEKLIVPDPHMAGVIEPGTKITLYRDFHGCSPLKKGDLVYFRYHSERDPVIRIVRGMPGDRFEVVKDPKETGWKIRVNDEFLKDGKGEDLIYGAPQFTPPLGLAAISHKNIIGENEVILMTNSSSGKFDSTLMGLISVHDIIGKVAIPETKN